MKNHPLHIKICCIQTLAEANLALRYGATELGFVSEMPSGPGVIPEEQIADIIRDIPKSVHSVLLTSRSHVDEIIAQQKNCQADIIQLCDILENGAYAELKAALSGVSLMHVIHVNGEENIEEALAMQHHVDMLLLDSGSKTAEVKILGGTGQTHDWSISQKICETVGIPVFLAGGLVPENVAEAVKMVQPYGVDVCTGVRTDFKLDERKMRKFIEAARKQP